MRSSATRPSCAPRNSSRAGMASTSRRHVKEQKNLLLAVQNQPTAEVASGAPFRECLVACKFGEAGATALRDGG